MQVTIDTEAIAAVVGAICGAAGAAITLALRVARPVRRHLERFQLFVEDWEGEPGRPGVAERPGMMVRMATVEDQVTLIGARQVQHEQAHAGVNGVVA